MSLEMVQMGTGTQEGGRSHLSERPGCLNPAERGAGEAVGAVFEKWRHIKRVRKTSSLCIGVQ